MLDQVLTACRERRTGELFLDGGRRRLYFAAGLLVAYEIDGLPQDPLRAIVPEARTRGFAVAVTAYVDRLRGAPLVLAPSWPAEASGLLAHERQALAQLALGPTTVDELEAGQPRSLHALLFGLALTGQLERATSPATMEARPASPTPIRSGPPQRSSFVVGEVRVSKGPPRRRSSGAMPAIRLSGAPARAPREEARSPHRDAEDARLALRHLDLARAVTLAERASAGAPERADYRALLCYARAEALGPPVGADSPHHDEALRELAGILASDPREASAHYFRGRLLQRLGRQAEAREAFAAAAELDPSNVDALREVKRWEKRTSGTHQAVQPKKRWFGLVS
ncbi:MAG: tetratricopeptide repeat protein [Polyangiaceae bacterium]